MSRQPCQVHIYLYRTRADGAYEFALFQREENPLWWQGVCGGAEGKETPEEAARRELFEEAGVSVAAPLYLLDTRASLPADLFSREVQEQWGKNVVVIPMIFFAMPFSGEPVLSSEHTDFRWLSYEEAQKLVYFSDQKTALWELYQRLLRGNLIR